MKQENTLKPAQPLLCPFAACTPSKRCLGLIQHYKCVHTEWLTLEDWNTRAQPAQKERKDDGWRILEVGEVRILGDEFNPEGNVWVLSDRIGTVMEVRDYGRYRRRISQPQGGEPSSNVQPVVTAPDCVICGNEITTYDSYGIGKGGRYHWSCIREEAATVSARPPVPRDLEALAMKIATEIWNCNYMDRENIPECADIVKEALQQLQFERDQMASIWKSEREQYERDLAALRLATELLVKERDALLAVVQLAYRKHHLDDDDIGWNELADKLHNALCNSMGDDGYKKWLNSVSKHAL